jgi:hypothetical protein
MYSAPFDKVNEDTKVLKVGEVVERIPTHDIDIDNPHPDPGRQGETCAKIGHITRTAVTTAEIDDEQIRP